MTLSATDGHMITEGKCVSGTIKETGGPRSWGKTKQKAGTVEKSVYEVRKIGAKIHVDGKQKRRSGAGYSQTT